MDKNIIDIVIDVKDAYKKAGSISVTKNVFKASSFFKKVFILFSFLIFIVSLLLMNIGIVPKQTALFISFIFASISALTMHNEIKKQYSSFYTEYSDRIKAFNLDRMYLRYLIFKSQLTNEIINNKENIEKVRNLLEEENELKYMPLYKQYPIITILLVMLTALINGLFSQTYLWKDNTLFNVLGVLVMLLYLAYITALTFKTKEYYNKELNIFLTWLSNDA